MHRDGSQNHLTEAQLLRLALGWPPVEQVEDAVFHLVGCSDCCRRAARSEYPEVPAWIMSLVAACLPYLPDEHLLTAVEFLPLLVLPPERRRRWVVRLDLARRQRYFEFALDLSRSFWHSDGELAHSSALDACVIAETEGMRPGARIRAWAFVVNALRVQRRFREALGLLKEVEAQEGRGERLDRAWLGYIATAAYRDLRLFAQCHIAGRNAAALFKKAKKKRAAGEVHLLLGQVLLEEGRLVEAERTFEQMLTSRSFTDNAEPATLFMARHNWAFALALQGKGFEAEKLQREAVKQSMPGAQPFFRLRRRWLHAVILQAMNQTSQALHIFREVRDAFLAEGKLYDAAQVALDLAFLTLKKSRFREGTELAEEIIPIFQAHGTEREAWMALSLLATSLREQTASLEQVLSVTRNLQKDRTAIMLQG